MSFNYLDQVPRRTWMLLGCRKCRWAWSCSIRTSTSYTCRRDSLRQESVLEDRSAQPDCRLLPGISRSGSPRHDDTGETETVREEHSRLTVVLQPKQRTVSP